MDKDIILAVDYHDENLEIRRFNCATGEECRENRPTTRAGILEVVHRAITEAAAAGIIQSREKARQRVQASRL